MKKRNLALVVGGFVLAACAIAVLITGCGQPVAEEGVTLLWWSESAGMVPVCDNPTIIEGWCEGVTEPGQLGDKMVEKWHELHPEYASVNIKPIVATYGGGRIGQELTAMVKAGEGPHIYNIYAGRAWLAYEIGIDHGKYLSEEDKADFLKPEYIGPIMASTGNFSYPVANATLIERACAQKKFDCYVPEPWTVVDNSNFMEILEAVKALDDGSYGVADWGTNPSGQNLTWGWMANAGFTPHTGEGFTGFAGAEEVMGLLNYWANEGYMLPGPTGLTDSEVLAAWGQGKVAFLHCREGYLPGFRDPEIEAGNIEPWDDVELIAIEVLPGVTPLVNGGEIVNAGFVADNTPEEYRAAAVSFLHYVLTFPYGQRNVDVTVCMKSMAERNYIEPGLRDEIMAYIGETGLADDGLTEEIYNLVREEWGKAKSAMYLGEMTPEEALASFQAAVAELAAK